MERFLTDNCQFGLLTVDTTFNHLGEFYVTIVTYPQLMLQDVCTGKHPAMVGPVLIHQQMDFPSFNYFAATLVSHNNKLRNALFWHRSICSQLSRCIAAAVLHPF